jgi:Oxidoreductase molybdopterin binding domain/Pentapeptide repeats (8 copies)
MSGPTKTLPPGQVETRKFPVVGEKAPAAAALELDSWRLILEGGLERPRELSYADLLALPQKEQVVDIHCVTGWTRHGTRITGMPLASLLAELGVAPLPAARFVSFTAYSDQHHDTSLPLDLALAETWLVHSVDGLPLTPAHGYPLRTWTPSRYFYKSLKWVHRIEFLVEDRLGYWERESAYHNNADPWAGNERYVSGSVPPEKVEAFRQAESYLPWRGPRKMLLGVDLRGWAPRTRDLGDLHLKNCDLRGAQLNGVNLRNANLTRSNLDGASLVGADLEGADLEGASFVGANLTGVNLTCAALSATCFARREPDGTLVGAQIGGLRWEGAAGLLEDQEAFLLGQII